MIGSTVLVTGGTGVIGRPLVAALLNRGRKVLVLSRKFPQESTLFDHPACSYLSGDVSLPMFGLDPGNYSALVDQVETIFHLAARTDFKGGRLEDYVPVNIDGVRQVYTLAKDSGAALHHVSTAFVRGDYSGIYKEETLDCGQGFRNCYEASKFQGEKYLREEIAAQHPGDGPHVSIYRPGIILQRYPSRDSVHTFGPFIFLDAIFRLLLAVHRRGEIEQTVRVRGNPEGALPFIFDDDVVEAILSIAVHTDLHGKTFHLVSREPCPNRLLEEVFNAAFGRTTACFVQEKLFDQVPASPAEKILSRKTAPYAPYLDVHLEFDRQQTEQILGVNWRPAISPEELLHAFGHYLLTKKQEERALVLPGGDADLIQHYFADYLPQFFEKQLLPGLKSLTCCFWLEIGQEAPQTLEIESGRLVAISVGKNGTFGYQVTSQTFLQVVAGTLPPQQGFFQGEIHLEGNTMEALRTATALEEFFFYLSL